MTKTQLTLEIVDPGVGFVVGSSRIGNESGSEVVGPDTLVLVNIDF